MRKNISAAIINPKLLTFVGFVAATSIAIWFTSTLAASLTTFFAAGRFASFLVETAFFLLGAFYGPGLYIQGLKEFKKWPMEDKVNVFGLSAIENHTQVSFRPNMLLKDIIFVLKKFDWEFAKLLGQLMLKIMKPEMIKTLNAQDAPPASQSWLSLESWTHSFKQSAKREARTFVNETAAPELARMSICTGIHMFAYYLHSRNQLNMLPTDQYKTNLSNESANYQFRAFMLGLHTTEKGVFESAKDAIYEEYVNPAKFAPST